MRTIVVDILTYHAEVDSRMKVIACCRHDYHRASLKNTLGDMKTLVKYYYYCCPVMILYTTPVLLCRSRALLCQRTEQVPERGPPAMVSILSNRKRAVLTCGHVKL
jgi:hypothetical protein